MKASLQIQLLGPFRLTVDGAVVDEKNFPRRKPKLLIKLLALQPHHQLHREQVMEFLWPDLDVASAANSLHKSIHAARRALEPALKSGADSRFIVTHEQQIQLRAPGGLAIDVEAFEQAAASALKSSEVEPYEDALKLYSGDLLLEDPYEEWTTARRDSLRALHSELLLKVAAAYESRQQYPQSIDSLKQLLVRDPANEEVHRGLMRLYALTGNRHQAIRQYQQCAEVIRQEFGTEPDAKTAELYKEIESGRTAPRAASQAYVKACYYWNKRTEGGLKKANEYFAQAIQENPKFAPAYAGLAESYALFSWYSVMRPKDAFPAARDAALRAIALDDSLAEAHTAMAFIYFSYDWNWTDGERELKRAIQLNPSYATAHQWYAIFLSGLARHDEAVAQIRRALEVDPISRVVNRDVGWVLYFARRYDEAIEAYRKTIELDPNFYIAHYFMGETYEMAGKFDEAIAEFRDTKTHALEEAEVWTLLGRARAHALLGEKDEARQLIDGLVELSKTRFVSPYLVAFIHVRLGDKESAFDWLARAYDERDSYLVYLAVEPVFDDLRSDRRFTELLRKVGLTAEHQQRIAILPLLNESADPEMDYLSDGVSESIINNLSQLPALRVLAWGTVAHYKGQKISPLEAGRTLDVDAVLTGRVLQVAQRFVVRAELIRSKDGVHLWGGQYDRELADIFTVQEQIANEISGNLRLKLTGQEKKRLTKRHTENPAAYQAYLKGRYYWNKRDVKWLKKGVEYFRQAIDLDPGYVLAYVGLSDSYTLLVVREALSPEEGFSKAKAAAGMALKIDDTVAEAYASLGHAMLHNWEWDAAEKQLRRSIELNSGYPSAHHWYSEHLTAMGRCDEGIAELKLASDLDPLSLVINADLGRAFYYARQYEQVIQQETRTLEMDPQFWLSHINLGRSFIQQGKHGQAIAELEKAAQASPGNTEVLTFLGFAYAAAGEREAALKTLASLEERTQQNHVPPYHFAILYSGLGDKEKAFEYLEQAYQKHAVDLFTLKVEPMFDGLRSDPRFPDLLRRVGLKSDAGRREIESVAILPLENLSSDPEMEYLSDGLTESIINSLSQVSRLKVIARSTVFRYKGQDIDPQKLGRRLGVRAVLTGRVLYRGDTLNIQTELVDVQDASQLWGEQYKRKSADVLEVQEEIAREIVAKLQVHLTGAEDQLLAKRYTANTNAYQLYLKGRYHWNKRTAERLQKGIECFQQAIEKDPKFALAYAGLSDCYAFLGDVGLAAIPSKDAFSRAKDAAVHALKIDDSLADAYLSLAHANMHHFEWAEAQQAFQRALALNPNHSLTHEWYAFYLVFNGRSAEAIAEAARALELDPLSVTAHVDFGQMFYYTGDFDKAVEQYLKTLELEPSHHKTYLWLGWAYEQKGMYEEAIRSFRRAEHDYTAEALAALGSVYGLSGKKDEARKIVAQLDEMSADSYVSPYEMSVLFLSLGDDDKAFEWLKKAYDQRAEWMIYLSVDPRFNRVRDTSRFKNILREVFGKNR